MNDERPPRADDPWFRRPSPPPGPPRRPDEPSQVIRRDPAYRPPQGQAPPPRTPPPPPWRPAQPPPPPRTQPPPPLPPRTPPPPPPPPQRRTAPPPQSRPPRPTAPPAPSGRRARKQAGRQAPKKRRRLPWIRILLAVVLVAITAIVGGGIWLDQSLHRIAALTDYPERPAPAQGTTWLLVGSDSRQDLTPEQQAALTTGGDIGSSRTDTVLLVHLPIPGSGAPNTMVSIPRDSYVPIPGYGSDKINAAFSIGGPQLLAQTVEQATGLRIDHYAEIGFGGFAVVVDALGGVSVCPAEPISDPLAGIELPAGCQQLDGRNALGYVRSRATPRADLDRMVNQRAFMSALLHRAASPAVWLNPWRWYAVPHAAADALTVNDNDHIWDLARLGWALRGTPITVTVPIGEFTSSDSGDVVVWDHEVAAELFDALATDSPIPQSTLDAQP